MRTISLYLGVLALLVSTYAHADLKLKVLPFNGSESQVLKERVEAFTRKYVDEHSLVSKNYPYTPAENYKDFLPLYWYYDAKYVKRKEAETLYALTFDGRDYLAAVISFNPLLTAEPHCQPNDSALPTGHCKRIATRQMTCHLFIFEAKTLALESVTPLNIMRDPRPMPGQQERSYQNYDEKYPNDPRQMEGWPACSKLLAVAHAKEIPDSLLFTLGYWDSATPTSKYDEPPLFKTSILLSFQTDAAGRLKIGQDDTCLKNPNSIETIPDARKALKQCRAKQ